MNECALVCERVHEHVHERRVFMNGRFHRSRPMNEREHERVHERVFMNGWFRRPRSMNERERTMNVNVFMNVHERFHERPSLKRLDKDEPTW